MKYLILVTVLALGACSSSPIFLSNSKGDVVQCGPYSEFGVINKTLAVNREAQCLNDFQRQGYNRIDANSTKQAPRSKDIRKGKYKVVN